MRRTLKFSVVLALVALIGCAQPTTESKPNELGADFVSNLPHADLDPANLTRGIKPGTLAIATEGVNETGQAISLASFQGKVVILDTWATW